MNTHPAGQEITATTYPAGTVLTDPNGITYTLDKDAAWVTQTNGEITATAYPVASWTPLTVTRTGWPEGHPLADGATTLRDLLNA